MCQTTYTVFKPSKWNYLTWPLYFKPIRVFIMISYCSSLYYHSHLFYFQYHKKDILHHLEKFFLTGFSDFVSAFVRMKLSSPQNSTLAVVSRDASAFGFQTWTQLNTFHRKCCTWNFQWRDASYWEEYLSLAASSLETAKISSGEDSPSCRVQSLTYQNLKCFWNSERCLRDKTVL